MLLSLIMSYWRLAKLIKPPTDPKVHVGDDGTIYDASLNQSQVAKNNNKFYRLQLLENDDGYHVHTRWGRVGEFGFVRTCIL